MHLGTDIIEPYFVEEPVDFVYHLASPASPIDYLRLPLHTLKVGSYGTHHTLGLAKAKRARFLIASTSEVYGDPQEHPQSETYWGHVNPIGPRGVYDEAKRYAEALTMAYHRQQGVDTAIVRIFNTYGSRMRPHDGRAIPTFLRQALANRPLTVFGDGSQTRSFCYVSDLIRGSSRWRSPGITTRSTSATPTSSRCWSSRETIKELTGSSSEIVYEALPVDDPKQRKPDITLARELLGLVAGGLAARRVAAHDRAPPARGPGRLSSQIAGATATSASLRRCEQRDGTTFFGTPSATARHGRGATDLRPTRERRRRRCPRRRRAASPPTATCAASARRRCRSCCGWPRAGASRACSRCWRSTSSGVALAIFTALVLKAAVLGHVDASQAFEETRQILAFAYLVTALLFARSGLYAERAQRPGLSRIVGSLFQVRVRRAAVRGRQRRTLLELLHLLGLARLRAAVRVLAARGVRVADGSAAARRRLPPPRGAGRHGQAHPRRRPRAR